MKQKSAIEGLLKVMARLRSPTGCPGDRVQDHRTLRRSFDTLYSFNPHMAKDPLVAGSFLRRALAFKDEGIQANDVKTLTEIRKNLAGARKDEGGKGLMDRAKELQAFAPKQSNQ